MTAQTYKSDSDDTYLLIGSMIGSLAAIITFIGAWLYCASEYGFLIGFGLGWFPSFLLATLVGGILYYLWLPIGLLILYFSKYGF